MEETVKKKRLNWPWLVLIAVVIIFGFFIFIRWWNRDVVSIRTVRVDLGTIEAIVSASGIVDAPIYELGSKMGGKIGDWRVREGEKVEKGQLMAIFDNYEQARNDFERASRLYKEGAVSKQAFDAAKTIYESSQISSPSDGVVAKVNFQEGETVVPGQTAIVVVNYDRSWVEAQIDEIDIGSVKIGDKVRITTDVYPEKIYEGEIYWIAPLAELRKVGGRVKLDEESYVFPCKIKFLGNHDELKANMSVNVDITAKRSENALVVPREALISKDDATIVYRISRGRAYENPLKIGIRSYSSVEALSGLSKGDVVAVSNVNKLKNKGRIKIEK